MGYGTDAQAGSERQPENPTATAADSPAVARCQCHTVIGPVFKGALALPVTGTPPPGTGRPRAFKRAKCRSLRGPWPTLSAGRLPRRLPRTVPVTELSTGGSFKLAGEVRSAEAAAATARGDADDTKALRMTRRHQDEAGKEGLAQFRSPGLRQRKSSHLIIGSYQL